MGKIMKLTCILCPRGCRLSIDEKNKVEGNFCPRGVLYATKEKNDPERMFTSIIPVGNRDNLVVSIKTNRSIKKGDISRFVEFLKNKKVNAPINIGDVLFKDVLGLNIDIIATKCIK